MGAAGTTKILQSVPGQRVIDLVSVLLSQNFNEASTYYYQCTSLSGFKTNSSHGETAAVEVDHHEPNLSLRSRDVHATKVGECSLCRYGIISSRLQCRSKQSSAGGDLADHSPLCSKQELQRLQSLMSVWICLRRLLAKLEWLGCLIASHEL